MNNDQTGTPWSRTNPTSGSNFMTLEETMQARRRAARAARAELRDLQPNEIGATNASSSRRGVNDPLPPLPGGTRGAAPGWPNEDTPSPAETLSAPSGSSGVYSNPSGGGGSGHYDEPEGVSGEDVGATGGSPRNWRPLEAGGGARIMGTIPDMPDYDVEVREDTEEDEGQGEGSPGAAFGWGHIAELQSRAYHADRSQSSSSAALENGIPQSRYALDEAGSIDEIYVRNRMRRLVLTREEMRVLDREREMERAGMYDELRKFNVDINPDARRVDKWVQMGHLQHRKRHVAGNVGEQTANRPHASHRRRNPHVQGVFDLRMQQSAAGLNSRRRVRSEGRNEGRPVTYEMNL